MKRATIWLLAAIVLVAGGVYVWDERSANVAEVPPVSEPLVAPAESAASSAAPVDQADDFVFRRVNIDTSQELPSACLVFSKALDTSGTVRYEDFIRFESGQTPAISVQDERLCLQGLAFASEYRVTVRKGMPSADGTELAYEEVLPIALVDRPSMVQFGEGLILPRHDTTGIPVTTVNVDLLDIRILRVGDRLLAQLERGLIDQNNLYSYDAWDLENESGEQVWTGQMVVKGQKNETVKTIFDIREAITDWKPGVYVVLAEDAAKKDQVGRNNFYQPTAAQWIIDSDLGLTTFDGSDGLHVFARSLKGAWQRGGVELTLVARNNNKLGTVVTNAQGYAVFPASLMRGTGGSEPAVLMAYDNGNDFNYLDLRRPAFDLTDRGVSGRSDPGEVDAYLYTERGIYRPGETVHLVSLVRDRLAMALDSIPLTISVRRPDGVEFRRLTSADQKSSATSFDFGLSATAPRGRWQAIAYIDQDSAPIGRVGFDVQDFVPERLEVNLDTAEAFWRPGQLVDVDVESRFLYGAAASDLGGEAELKIMRDPNPYPDFPGYVFGRIKEAYRDLVINIDLPTTDQDGRALLQAEIPKLRDTTVPLRARMRIGVYEPGGRATKNELYRPVRTREIMIGIRPDFDGGRVREETPAGFEIITLNEEGSQVARDGLRYRLVREETSYQWYQVRDRWQYERIVRDRNVSDGQFVTDGQAPARLSETLSWGSYRLMVFDDASGAASSVRFYVGWGGDSSGGRPDKVTVTSEKDTYTPGETAAIEIRPPASGKALVVLANDRVFETREIQIDETGAGLGFTVSEDWGAGVYALVTVFKPLSSEDERAPVRSIGLTWLGVDQSSKTISVDIETPERITPRQQVTIPLTVQGLGAGEQAHVTLAAVDQGILQLTKFKTPSPEDHYFAKRQLALDVRDDYGRLITDQDGVMGELRVGGDALGGRGLSVVPTKTVALFSGLVETDSTGAAQVSFNIPDFVGELRLMAVAMTDGKVGHGETTLTIRDDVVADMTLPRFLAPGDQARATLLVDNVDGAAGEYAIDVVISGATATDNGSFKQSVSLAEDERQLVTIPISGTVPGIGTISLTLTGPSDYRVQRSWPLEVRPSQLHLSEQTVALMAPGETLSFDQGTLERFYGEEAQLSVTVSGTRPYDVPGLLDALDQYPYGCLEQTTSRAFPLLYYDDLLLMSGTDDPDLYLQTRVQNAVDRVIDMQSSSGAFGMWGPASYDADAWLSVFALDFVLQARDQDYIVPQDSIERGLRWLKNVAGESYRDNWERSYAFYVLASQGQINPGDLRYFADRELKNISNPLSAAQVAAALAMTGDKSRARKAFDTAIRLAGLGEAEYEQLPYGSRLRDLSGVLVMASKADETSILPAVFDASDQLDRQLRFTTTQEKAWMLFAAYTLSKNSGRLDVEVEGYSTPQQSDPIYVTAGVDTLSVPITLRNDGEKEIWKTVTVSGVPQQPIPAEANGMTLRKSIFTLDGRPANLANVQQNDRFIVLLQGQVNNDVYREMIALDLLPAGLEIDSVLAPGDQPYTWLPKLSGTKMVEARDDRFVAAFDISTRWRSRPPDAEIVQPPFSLAYVARAVSVGDFVLPAARVEDMYAPKVFAQTEAGRLTVTGP